jgi:hypothetical protein
MKCPICQKHELVAQSLEDSYGCIPDIFCPEVVRLPDGKIINHYREFSIIGKIRMIAWPYRVINWKGQSQISQNHKYKSGKSFFKTILKTPLLHPDTDDRLRERIKLLLLLS